MKVAKRKGATRWTTKELVTWWVLYLDRNFVNGELKTELEVKVEVDARSYDEAIELGDKLVGKQRHKDLSVSHFFYDARPLSWQTIKEAK